MIENVDLTGMVYVVTSADGNICTEVERSLAERNATIVMGFRSQPKCQGIINKIRETTFKGTLEIGEPHDLSSKETIKKFAAGVISKYKTINGIINSAGLMAGVNHMTKDNLNLLLQVDMLGPALLTDLLLPVLRGPQKGQVVNVIAGIWMVNDLENGTIDDIVKVSTTMNDPISNFGVGKVSFAHHAFELAKREKDVATFAVNLN